MKKFSISILLLLTFVQIGAIADIPEGLEVRIKNPPSISGGGQNTYTCSTNPTIIEGDDFITLINFGEADKDGRVEYQFRSYSKQHKLEVSGKGTVFENYYRIRDPNMDRGETRVVDKGSQLIVDAGIVTFNWSAGNHIYLSDGVTAKQGNELLYFSKIKK